MLSSSRFTTIPTKRTRRRLEQAQDNRKPISRRERNRPAVMAIQAALADLNRDYLLSAEVDGYFGSRTYAAVEAFQRDYGLVADGQVGRQTMAQLDSLYSGDVMRTPTDLSIHIGVDKVDPGHYGGEYPLNSCVNDARKMHEFAESIGYDALLLTDEAATTAHFTAFMRNAAENLYDGDSLFISFSGHGSQVLNNSVDAEGDGKDETLCFFDRMLIDDELYALLGEFGEGIRVHLVFDSCHSGTAAKLIAHDADDKETYAAKALKSIKSLSANKEQLLGDGMDDEVAMATRPIASKSLAAVLDGDAPEFRPEPTVKKDQDKEVAAFFADLYEDETKGPAKSIELFNGIYARNKMLYDTVGTLLGDKSTDELRCTVVSLSACQDLQTTPAGSYLSLFTANIDHAWKSGAFDGSYREFYQAIKRETNRPDVVPAMNTYGPSRAGSRVYERPFVI